MTSDERIEAEPHSAEPGTPDVAEDAAPAPDTTPVEAPEVSDIPEQSPEEVSGPEQMAESPVDAEPDDASAVDEGATDEADEAEAADAADATVAENTAETEETSPVAEQPEGQPALDATLREESAEASPKRAGVLWWPFIVYALVWVALAAATFFVLRGPEAALPAFRQEYYPYLLLAGLTLTLLGPLMSVLLWFLAWRAAEKSERGGLFTQAMIRGAAITFLGVAAWYGALNLVDVVRLGWI